MDGNTIDGAEEIEKIARAVIRDSKAWGVFPTPVDRIVSYAELQIANGVDLSKIEPGFFTEKLRSLQRAMSKILAAVDLRERTIYLDLSQLIERQRFNKLHETGHKVLGWQHDAYVRLDDAHTLDPDTGDLFERQASSFAADALFQVERYDDEAAKLPLAIKSPLALATMFGGSKHASLRRYAQKCKKRCALLVFNRGRGNGDYAAEIYKYFQSPSFTAEFGLLQWPRKCGLEFPFVREFKFGRRLHESGQFGWITATGEFVTFDYHYFSNSYNFFVLLFPPGEKIRSRTTIVMR